MLAFTVWPRTGGKLVLTETKYAFYVCDFSDPAPDYPTTTYPQFDEVLGTLHAAIKDGSSVQAADVAPDPRADRRQAELDRMRAEHEKTMQVFDMAPRLYAVLTLIGLTLTATASVFPSPWSYVGAVVSLLGTLFCIDRWVRAANRKVDIAERSYRAHATR